MAKTERSIPRGAGADDPEFNVDVGLQAPGLANVPVQDQFSQLSSVLLSGLGNAASGLQNIAQVDAIMENKKEKVIAQQERDLALSNESLLQAQFDRAKSDQRDLLMDERATNPEWLLQNAAISMDNAATEPEKELWFRLVSAAQEQLAQKQRHDETEAKRQQIEDLNLAGLAATRVIQTMSVELMNDPELQRDLIGNGQNITKRVENWVLAAATDAAGDQMALPANSSKEERQARDRVMANLMAQSLPISEALTRQYVKQVETANEEHATESLDALMLGMQKGQAGDDVTVRASLTHIDENYLNHLTKDQKEQFRQKYLTQAVKDAATLTFTEDVTKANKAIDSFVKNAGITPADQVRAKEAANDLLAKSALQKFSAQVDNELAASGPIINGVRLPNTDPVGTLGLEDSMGVSSIRKIANSFLEKSGLGPNRTDLSSSESQIRQGILEQVLQVEQQAAAAGRAAKTLQQKGNEARANLSTGDPLAMYKTNPMALTRSPEGVYQNPEIMGAIKLTGLEQMQWGADPAVPMGVGPVAMVPETRPVRSLMSGMEAQKWNNVTAHKFPAEMLTDMASKFKSQNPEDMFDVVQFMSGLGSTPRRSFLKDMSSNWDTREKLALSMMEQSLRVSNNPSGEFDQIYERVRDVMLNDKITDQSLKQNYRDELGRMVLNPESKYPQTQREYAVSVLGTALNTQLEKAGLPGLALTTQETWRNPMNLWLTTRTTETSKTPETPSEYQLAMQNAANFKEDDLNLMAAQLLSLKSQGMSEPQAAAAVWDQVAEQGLRPMVKSGSVRFIFEPQPMLGPEGRTEEEIMGDVQKFLQQKPDEKMQAKLQGMYNIKAGDKRAVALTNWYDAMRIADPDRFGTPGSGGVPEVRLGYHTESWNEYASDPVQPRAVLLFKDRNGIFSPIMFDGEIVSVYNYDWLPKAPPKAPLVSWGQSYPAPTVNRPQS